MLYMRQRNQVLGTHLRHNSQTAVFGEGYMEFSADIVHRQAGDDGASMRVDLGDLGFGLGAEFARVGINMGDENPRAVGGIRQPTSAAAGHQPTYLGACLQVDDGNIAAESISGVEIFAAAIDSHAGGFETRLKGAEDAQRCGVDLADIVRPGIGDIDSRSVRADGDAAGYSAHRYSAGNSLSRAIDHQQLVRPAADYVEALAIG